MKLLLIKKSADGWIMEVERTGRLWLAPWKKRSYVCKVIGYPNNWRHFPSFREVLLMDGFDALFLKWSYEKGGEKK